MSRSRTIVSTILVSTLLAPLAAAARPAQAAELIGSAGAAGAAGTSPSGDANLDRAVKKANTEWIVSMQSGDAARIAEPYEDDAVFVALDGTATRGRAEIEAMLKARFGSTGPATATKIEPRSVRRESDQLAVEVGAVEIRRAGADGKEAVTTGHYVTVWQRQDDGTWKIHRNVVLP